jgi:hypothetical protein
VGKKVKASEVEKGQKVRVESHDGMVEGTVDSVREAERRGNPIIWVNVRTGENEFIHSMHEPDGQIDLVE